MDRRHFLKTLWASSLLSPIFMNFKLFKNQAYLYLVSDSPQHYLPPLLQEMSKRGLIGGPSFFCSGSVSSLELLKKALILKKWRCVDSPSQADFFISFKRLHFSAKPSFTLINHGEIIDIRSKQLLSLWLELNRQAHAASLITIVSSSSNNLSLHPGNWVKVYQDGRFLERISLKKKFAKEYKTKNGLITILIENHQAQVIQSSCLQQICRFTPPISIAGDRIICAPNHFLIEVAGSSMIDTAIG